MVGEAQKQKVGGVLLWILAFVLAVAGAVHALRSTGHAASEPVLHAVHGSGDQPCVSVRQLGGAAMDEELQVAALRLGLRWEEQGYSVLIPQFDDEASEGRGDGSQAAYHEVLLGTLGAPAADDPELEQRAWRSLGLSRQLDAWVTPDGRSWPRESCSLAVTLAQTHFQGVVRRLNLLGLVEPARSDAALVTLLLRPTGSLSPALPRLGSPPVSPGVVLWSGGQRVFEVDLDKEGFATQRVRSYPAVLAAPSGSQVGDSTAFADLAAAAGRYGAAIRSLGKKSPSVRALEVAELTSVEAYLVDGPLQRSGWYDATHHRLMVIPGLAASADDAVEDFLEAELLRTFGRPASPWLVRGLIYVFTGRAGGFSLMDLESRSQPIAVEDVWSSTRRRTRLALAPAEARLARGVLAEYNSDVRAAWTAPLGTDGEMADRLRSQWKEGHVKAPVVPASFSARNWSGGVALEVVNPARGMGQFGSSELHTDFERIASLGFDGVRLAVHVPVVPPTPAERGEIPFAVKGWGYNVTLEGDGALLASAAAAQALGLSVVLEPRFVVSATGVLGHKQVHGSPERIRQYGERRALAMEGVAWLAEQAGAEALVMFDPEELPRAIGTHRAALKQQAEAARTITREQSAVYASPFAGERIALSRSLGGMTRAAEAKELTAGRSGAASEPGAAPLTAVGLELTLDSADAPKSRTRRVLLASREAGGELRALRILGLDSTAPLGEEPTWSVLSSLGADPGPGPGRGKGAKAPTEVEKTPHAVWLGPWRMASKGQSLKERMAAGRLPSNLRAFSDERLRQLAAVPR